MKGSLRQGRVRRVERDYSQRDGKCWIRKTRLMEWSLLKMQRKRRTYVPVTELQRLLHVIESFLFWGKKSNVTPRQVKQEKVSPMMFSVDVPIQPGMKLDHFQPNGRPCYILDHITPGPTIPSKIHPERAKKRQRNWLNLSPRRRKGDIIRGWITRYQYH